jgi:hypothetical protein
VFVLIHRPATYIPRVEVQVTELVKASVLKPLQALKLRAKKDFVRNGVNLTTGQEYLHKQDGAYLPEVTEEVVETINATILTDKKALHLRAKETFKVCCCSEFSSYCFVIAFSFCSVLIWFACLFVCLFVFICFYFPFFIFIFYYFLFDSLISFFLVLLVCFTFDSFFL